MAFLHDAVLDGGLDYLDTATTALHLLPSTYSIGNNGNTTDYTNATTNGSSSLGSKTSLSIGAPDDATSGREVTVAAFTDGSISTTGTATQYAIVDTANSLVLVLGDLSASQAVTSGNTFSLQSFTINIQDPA